MSPWIKILSKRQVPAARPETYPPPKAPGSRAWRFKRSGGDDNPKTKMLLTSGKRVALALVCSELFARSGSKALG